MQSEFEKLNLNEMVVVGDKSAPTAMPEKIICTVGSEQFEVPCDPKKTVLENLISGGVNAPYSCMDGACMACLGKVKKGKVYQHELYVLTDDNIDQGETLTCQARCASQIVEIDYDTI